MKPSTPTHVCALLATVLLAACSQQPAGNDTQPASNSTTLPGGSAPVIPAPPAPAGTASLPDNHATTSRYKIAIDLPNLPTAEQPLADALDATADHAKRAFMQALPDPQQFPEFADRQLELLLDFKVVAQTPRFTSVRETGMQGTGGAHPLPVEAAFVFDRKSGQLIVLDALFGNPDAARKALASFAHNALLKKLKANAPSSDEGSATAIREWHENMRQMLDSGTQPTSVNYSIFIVRAGADPTAASPGITLIFPPYQVAPYVAGTQTVAVPTEVFARYLKPGYRDAFAGD